MTSFPSKEEVLVLILDTSMVFFFCLQRIIPRDIRPGRLCISISFVHVPSRVFFGGSPPISYDATIKIGISEYPNG